ncbi:MAG: tRNA lysidine(34) synthetase TilS [Desulfobacterales bacterium]|jgi:tRNA(Ile)-lysidine synthase
MLSQPKNHRKKPVEKKVVRKVKQAIAEHSMFQAGDRVLVAVSGGADSVALLHLLETLTPLFSFRLGIAHLNHCLRKKESERDAEFVSRLAKKLNLPAYIEKNDVHQYKRQHKLSLEEAARKVRYSFLNKVAKENGFNKIALGHHYDDNAELVLMFLLRGSGPLGLSGIPAARDDKIVRPLINVRRSEIMDYLTEKKLEYVSDTSNTDLDHQRNKLRYDLIPKLSTSYNPRISETLNRLAAVMRSEDEWLEKLIEPIFRQHLLHEENIGILLSLEGFERLPRAAQRRLIRRALLTVKGDLRRITYTHIATIIRLANTGPTTGTLDLPDRIMIQRNHQVLSISKAQDNLRSKGNDLSNRVCPPYEYVLDAPGMVRIQETGDTVELVEIGIEEIPDLRQAGQQRAFFDINKVHFPLIVRNFRPGDRFSPLGMTGTQKLKKFFINNKISRELRARCPLVVSNHRIIWVAGHRIDDSVKVGTETGAVLMAELLLA